MNNWLDNLSIFEILVLYSIGYNLEINDGHVIAIKEEEKWIDVQT